MTEFEDEDHDVFEEETSEEEVTEEDSEEQETGDKEEVSEEPPSKDDESKSDEEEKMVPESRLKQAIKGISEELEEAKAKLAKYQQTPVPDRNEDPDGYEAHVRLETSRDIMRSTKPDYEEKIKHFIEMTKSNPELNKIVAADKMPAKMAYDIATEDLNIRELRELKNSPDWQEYQKWKQEKATAKTSEKLAETPKVPNLNRKATAVDPKVKKTTDEDDDLFAGHFSVA